MSLTTLWNYLLGRRDAVLRIAQCQSALWIGLVFVLAAGLAREYDGEDLLHEPWHLLIPLGASLASSFLLYLLVRLVACLRGSREPGFWRGYRPFLALYWLTAPLAMIYAVPVERFLSAGDAMATNLWFLGFVAVWRVLLITRVVSVLYGASFVAAFFPVMLFADSVLLLVLYLTPLPMLMIMGGVRLSESDSVLLGTTLFVGFLGYVTWFVWLMGSIAVASVRTSTWRYKAPATDKACTATRWLWSFAIAAVVLCAIPLPYTQSEQRLRRRAEKFLEANQIRDALVFMSAHEQDDFPPHWDPPPHLTHHNPRPEMIVVQETAQSGDLKPWVRAIFNAKFADSLRAESWMVLFDLPPAEVERRLKLLEQLSDLEPVVEDHLRLALEQLQSRTDLSHQSMARIESLLKNPKKALADPPTETEGTFAP